jgi:glutamate-ammonia-ligase adenylyltransferase
MRRQMLDQIGAKGPWDVKHSRGGLVDVEFIAQYVQIANADRHPGILRQNTLAALAALEGRGLLISGDSQILRRVGALYHRLTQVLRLCVAGEFVAADAPSGLRQLVAAACGTPDLASAEALLCESQQEVTGIFHRLIGPV